MAPLVFSKSFQLARCRRLQAHWVAWEHPLGSVHVCILQNSWQSLEENWKGIRTKVGRLWQEFRREFRRASTKALAVEMEWGVAAWELCRQWNQLVLSGLLDVEWWGKEKCPRQVDMRLYNWREECGPEMRFYKTACRSHAYIWDCPGRACRVTEERFKTGQGARNIQGLAGGGVSTWPWRS